MSAPAIESISRKAPGKWLTYFYSSFADDGVLPGQRIGYWLYLPSHDTPTPLPLVVMLHGCSQTAAQFSQGTRFNQLAEEKGFAVVYPQQSLRRHPTRCWNWHEKKVQEGHGEVKLIVGIIEQVVRKYRMDRTRIYIAGLSAGAALANIVALHFPEMIAAVGMHSGPAFGAGHSRVGALSVMQTGAGSQGRRAINALLERTSNIPPLPAVVIHGRDDAVVRPVNANQVALQFQVLNRLDSADAKPVVLKNGKQRAGRNLSNPYRILDHYRGRKLMLRVYDIERLGHAWSGGDSVLRFNASEGPDASRLMWDFFKRHQRLPSARVRAM
ncbi:alpha/beta hydrolase family esterase [Herbaspirillum sp. GCM10030257]|uniref:extracellular catalytic domain type 1 short-chain-length polyhydroxyalkanoate depolymerase n=1 Tax=Herbaspirillum sp. GCM10030257 TaxID=3273393 RepID=UPI0036155EA5